MRAINENGTWKKRYQHELYKLYTDVNILRWVGDLFKVDAEYPSRKNNATEPNGTTQSNIKTVFWTTLNKILEIWTRKASKRTNGKMSSSRLRFIKNCSAMLMMMLTNVNFSVHSVGCYYIPMIIENLFYHIRVLFWQIHNFIIVHRTQTIIIVHLATMRPSDLSKFLKFLWPSGLGLLVSDFRSLKHLNSL